MKKNIKYIALGLVAMFNLNSADAQDNGSIASKSIDNNMEIIEFQNIDYNFQKQLGRVFNITLELNNAFSSIDKEKIGLTVQDLKKQLGKVDDLNLKMEEHRYWLQNLEVMYSNLRGISRSKSIEDKKRYFAKYNTGLYNCIKAYGIRPGAFYQFCPMANNNEGAYWVSNTMEIRNPFMGEDMADCGILIEILN